MAKTVTRDVQLPPDAPTSLLIDKHLTFLETFAKNKDGFEQTMVEYLRMSGIYWSLVAVHLMGQPDRLGELCCYAVLELNYKLI